MNRYFLIAALLLCLVSCRTEVQQRVYGRYVPERKDDFAWENEYAAFRLYGPALAPENPSNGIDLWLKNSPALVIDTMYGRELRDNRPYHINYDGNLDCYKVAHTAGCGGIVILAANGQEPTANGLSIGGPYSSWEILEQTADKFVFRLIYDSVPVAGQILQQTLTITAETGTPWNKAEVVLTAGSANCSPLTANLYMGGGIFLHDTVDNVFRCEECGMVAYAEDALSDKAAARMNFDYNGSTSQGRAYIAVRTPGATFQQIIDGTLVSLRPYSLGDTLTYYFAACWSEWSNGSLSFPADDDWFNMVKQTIK